MLSAETEVVLANLDHLQVMHGYRLDYASRAVLDAAGEPVCLLDDLASPELTPAGRRMVGRLPLAICTAAAYDGVLG